MHTSLLKFSIVLFATIGWTGRKYMLLLDLVSCPVWTLWTNIVASGVDSSSFFSTWQWNYGFDTKFTPTQFKHPFSPSIYWALGIFFSRRIFFLRFFLSLWQLKYVTWLNPTNVFILVVRTTMCTFFISSSFDSTSSIRQKCFSCHTCILRLVPWDEHELQDSIHCFTKLISRPPFMVEVLHDSLMASMVLVRD